MRILICIILLRLSPLLRECYSLSRAAPVESREPSSIELDERGLQEFSVLASSNHFGWDAVYTWQVHSGIDSECGEVDEVCVELKLVAMHQPVWTYARNVCVPDLDKF
jgi:hypothetical protein